MKKMFAFAIATLFTAGVALACDGNKKEAKACCKKGEAKTEAKACCKKETATASAGKAACCKKDNKSVAQAGTKTNAAQAKTQTAAK
jgi:hypothetical protein